MRLPAMFNRLLKKRPVEKGQMQTSVVKTLPAPVRGLNSRDPKAAMDPRFAIVLENWFPRQGDVVIRNGCDEYAEDFAHAPKTLCAYEPPTASRKLYAVSDDGFFDISAPGVVGATVKAVTNGYMNWTQMGVSGGHYLLAFNGVDSPIYFDGTTWTSVTGVSTPALTGVTTSGLVFPCIYKRRLFILERNKLSFWYLASDAVGGALSEFALGPLCSKGGYTMAAATWTLDGGAGPDDYFVLVTSEGEVIVFTGTNPGSAADWSLVGVYYVGKPLGRKCMKKAGGDLVLITESGVFPLSKVIQSATIDFKTALTNAIEGIFTADASTYGSIEGWTIELLPAKAALIINVPTSATSSKQYVMNTITKAWCVFTGWNAHDLAVYNKELYFADQADVAKAWTGRSDYGADIVAVGQTAFQNFGSISQLKNFTLYRPMLAIDGTLAFSVGLAIDFNPTPTFYEASYVVQSGAIWDTSLWDSAYWAAGLMVKNEWQTPGAYEGYWAAGCIKVATNEIEVQWAANDYNFIVGGVVG